MTPFIKLMKSKYPDIDVQRAIRIYELEIASIIPFPGKDAATIGLKNDLAKHVFLKSMNEYMKGASAGNGA